MFWTRPEPVVSALMFNQRHQRSEKVNRTSRLHFCWILLPGLLRKKLGCYLKRGVTESVIWRTNYFYTLHTISTQFQNHNQKRQPRFATPDDSILQEVARIFLFSAPTHTETGDATEVIDIRAAAETWRECRSCLIFVCRASRGEEKN